MKTRPVNRLSTGLFFKASRSARGDLRTILFSLASRFARDNRWTHLFFLASRFARGNLLTSLFSLASRFAQGIWWKGLFSRGNWLIGLFFLDSRFARGSLVIWPFFLASRFVQGNLLTGLFLIAPREAIFWPLLFFILTANDGVKVLKSLKFDLEWLQRPLIFGSDDLANHSFFITGSRASFWCVICLGLKMFQFLSQMTPKTPNFWIRWPRMTSKTILT